MSSRATADRRGRVLACSFSQGNEYYMAKQWEDALDCYSLALVWCPEDDSEKESRAVYFCNRAACNIKLQSYQEVVADCEKAIELKVINQAVSLTTVRAAS